MPAVRANEVRVADDIPRTESVYRRSAIMLNEAGTKVQTFYGNSTKAEPNPVLRLSRARTRDGVKA